MLFSKNYIFSATQHKQCRECVQNGTLVVQSSMIPFISLGAWQNG